MDQGAQNDFGVMEEAIFSVQRGKNSVKDCSHIAFSKFEEFDPLPYL